ncbi:low-density lipoprotein receptor-related protein 2-like [Pecten maximus]|uniref:low-density lipoprotein receptor-related protein 2-like n=1 Tax=Pecten maximus TaxID=6579 RepID=UPI0014584CAB|nr:low-density lipoprotein receptor-related protein 2-like [Pecten maximus]
MESPVVVIGASSCLMFYVYGQNELPLRLSLKHTEGHITRIGDCNTVVGKELDWYRITMDIPSGNYSLIFEAGEHFWSRYFGLCLDDISVMDGQSCDNIGCGPNEFLCHNSSLCIPAHRQCDSIINCPDGEDEQNCRVSS